MIDELTPSQVRVLRAIAIDGHWAGVATRLGLSEKYVKSVAHAAYRRLGVHSVIEAYVALGWVTLPPDADPPADAPKDPYLWESGT